MSRPALAGSRRDDRPVPSAPVSGGDDLATPADGFARVTSVPRPQRPPPPVDERSARTLREDLHDLFTEGGVTIRTYSDGDDDVRLVASTVIQPDGDLVTTYRADADPVEMAQWTTHVASVAGWFQGMQRQLDRAVRRLEDLRLLAFALAPLVAVLLAGRGGGVGSLDDTARVAAIGSGTVAAGEMLLARRQSGAASDGERRFLLERLRSSRGYNLVLSTGPAIMAVAAGMVDRNPVVIAIAVGLPLSAVALVAGAVLWARRRFLG